MGFLCAARLPGTAASHGDWSRLAGSAPGGATDVRVTSSGQWTLVSASAAGDAWLAQSGAWCAAVTGALDNRHELGRAVGLGEDADPAAIAIEWRRSGRSIVEWRGMFSLVVTDGETLWAARDHLGFSPLFYAIDGPAVAVASRPRQALLAIGKEVRPDVETIEPGFFGVHPDETRTALDGVRRLPKMTTLEVRDDGIRSSRYWDPASLLETRSDGLEDLRDEFHGVFRQAVERTLTEGAVVALSGGIDSPAVAAYAAPAFCERYGRPMPALSAVYPDLPSVDERRYIELAARTLGMELHTYRPVAHPLQDARELVALSDGPVPTVSLAESEEHYRMAAAMGYRTILTGEMAEFVMALGTHTLAHLLLHGRLLDAARYLAAERSRGVPLRSLTRKVAKSLIPERILAARRGATGASPQARVEWLDQGSFVPPRSVGLRRRWRHAQLAAFEGAGWSVEADQALQERSGVRVRRPWMDVDLLEFFLSLPAHAKYPNGRYKGLVKEWLRGRVPDEILDRRDRTYFDDSFMQRLSFDELERLIFSTDYRMPGVDYQVIATRLRGKGVDLIEAMWLKDLAMVHAFMGEWE